CSLMSPCGSHSRSRKATDSSSSQRAAQHVKQSKAAPRMPTTNPSLLIFTAVATCQKKNGLSMQCLKKIVTNMGYDMTNKKQYFLRSIKRMLTKGLLLQVKGNGATGSFKINPHLEKKKQQQKMKGKGQKAKEATKKKNVPAKARNGKNNAKKQGKVDSSKRVTKRSKIPPLQAVQSQVKV
uniref:H15 domain-containing protein n=1 Tax=Anolis carolinensis TaxID=28377 RepID=A0A803SL37_ANOCA